MKIQVQKPLFAWDCLEDSPTLKTIKQLLETLPDEALIEGLEQARGKGRNDFSIPVLWRTVVLAIALRHPHLQACLAELRRNPALRKLIGIESEERVPEAWNLSRFLDTLGKAPHRERLHQIFNTLTSWLGECVDSLGRNTAGDATALNARRKTRGAGEQQEKAGDLPRATGGRKEYQDDDGKVSHVVEWFGFKLHLLADVKNEVALSYKITDTKAGDGETLPAILADAMQNLPEGRIETLAYDKAADTNEVHRLLSQEGIKPVIQIRALWKEEPERLLPDHNGSSNIVYDEAGTVYCYDRVSEPMVRHPMAYIGHEPARQTIKYRCPARHEGWECPMSSLCNAGKDYGLTVRVPREIDLRRFPSLPRATKKFERLYKGRTAVERLNARLKVFWGVNDGNVTGSQRFFAHVGVVMVVHSVFAFLLASAPRWEGTLSQTKLTPIARALHGRAKQKKAPPRRSKGKSEERQLKLPLAS